MLEKQTREFLAFLRYNRNVSPHTLRAYETDLEQFVASIATAPVVWLPAHLGYAGWLLLQLAVLAVLALAVVAFARLPAAAPAAATSAIEATIRSIFINRWPAAAGGAAVRVPQTD